MTCPQCGTEIADKAIVCYRCGRPTAGPSRPGGGERTSRPRGSFIPALALVLLVIAALFMGSAASGEVPRGVAWTVAGLAAVILGWRLFRRR